MLFFSCIMLQVLILTSHAAIKKANPGPPCFGRSDCVKPLNDDPATTETSPPHSYMGPKRYIRDDRFKSPVFGSYKFNPLMGEFEVSNQTDTVPTAPELQKKAVIQQSTVMRAFDPVDVIKSSGHARRNQFDYDD